MRSLTLIRARRLLAVVVGALVVTLCLTVAPASATSDWTRGSAPSTAKYRTASSKIYGGKMSLGVWWKGTDVSVNGRVDDTAGDGRCAIVRIRYQIYYKNKWSGWHHRTVGERACGKGNFGIVYSIRGRYPTRKVKARVCLTKKNSIVTCDPKWR